MQISIFVINNKPDKLNQCLDSIINQSYKTLNYIVVDTNNEILLRDDVTIKGILSVLKNGENKNLGDYFFIMFSDNYFENDTVLEDVVLNEFDKDIIFCDSILNKDSQSLSNENIISSVVNKLSDIIIKPFCFQSTFIRKELLLNYKHEVKQIDYLSEIRLFFADLLINKKCSYKNIYLPVLHINIGLDDFNKKYLTQNDSYFESLKQLLPFHAEDYKELSRNRTEKSNHDYMLLQKIGKSSLFQYILKFRSLLFKTGYYKRKAERRNKEYIKFRIKKDFDRKKEVERLIYELPLNMLSSKKDASDIVVSLTSHNRRVLDSAPYAIYSMFCQTVLPNRIILFISENGWNDDNIPSLVKRLKQSGLEVVYCEDVRSHTKLIPALKLFPENPIITIDDDIYYNDKTVEELLIEYAKSDKQTVICHQGCYPQKRFGKFLPYSEWESNKTKYLSCTKLSHSVSAYGVSGVIYPPHIFTDEVFNTEVFLNIAPHTDDIWFWLMEYMNNVNVKLISNSSFHTNVSVDYAEYANPEGSLALYFDNCFNGRNDEEFNKLLEYYKIES